MRMIKPITVILLVALSLSTSAAIAQDINQMIAREADMALAQRMGEWAQATLRSKVTVDPVWKETAALLEAAARLSPDDPRYVRFLAEAQLQTKNVDGAIAALKDYNERLNTDDLGSQIQLIDLYASRIETAENKLKYLRDDILGNPGVAEEVRSYAAVNAARLAEERGEMQEAASLLGQSLRLNPLNGSALRMRMEWLTYGGTPLERVTTLLMLMRSNPAQPGVIMRVADELAAVGAVDESLQWYVMAINMLPRLGVGVPRELVLKYATELAIAEQYQAADGMLAQLQKIDPNDVESWLVRLVAARRFANKDDLAKAQDMARNALMNRLNTVRMNLGNAQATTRPVEDPGTVDLPDLSDDVKHLLEAGTETQKADFVRAAQDLAFYELFVEKSPADAKRLIEALKSILPEDSITLARLEGWDFLIQDKKDEAKVKLSAVADSDPLAAMGMIRLAPADDLKTQQEADSIGRKLITDTPSGLLGLILRDGLRDRPNVKFVPTVINEAVRNELAQFPMDWMRVIDQPQAFYIVRAEPLKVGTAYHEPMFAKVTFQNISNYDITIGREGVIRPDLWFDANLKGIVQQQFIAAAYDRLTSQITLRARSSMTQIVRVDQGELASAMQGIPSVTLQVYASVMTNPNFTQQGLVAGPGGQRVVFQRMFVRTGMPMSSEESRQRIIQAATQGNPTVRMANLEILAVYAGQLLGNKEANDQTKQVAQNFINVIRGACNDPTPSISALAWFQLTIYNSNQESRAAMIKDMLDNPQWQRRLIGLLSMRGMAPQTQLELLGKLPDTDPDPVVGRYATAVQEFAKMATTRPSTEATPATDLPPAMPDLGTISPPTPGTGVPATNP